MSDDLKKTSGLVRECPCWQTILDEYAGDSSIDGLLLVGCVENSRAEVELCRKNSQGVFYVDCNGSAYIGKNGLGKVREGDGMTPEGDFDVRRAFGILPNPGTCMEYFDITDTMVACDEEGEHYNQIVDTRFMDHPCGGEQMAKMMPEYSYGLELNYNPQNVYPKGSAIFVHCKGKKAFTMGCVAIDESLMRHVLVSSRGLKVCIRQRCFAVEAGKENIG